MTSPAESPWRWRARAALWTAPAALAAYALLLLWLPPATAASASQQSAEIAGASTPLLVIDAGRHTGPVRRLALSADARLVVTASDDKTAALWRADTGERLHVLRALPGPGSQGRLYGAAFHPTQALVAVGGSGAPGADATIQWHSSDSGEALRRTSAGRGEIKRLAFSGDGRWLLAAFAAPGAVRVFGADGRRVFEAALTGDAYGLDVHANGRVAVTDSAGALHLFTLGGDGRLTDARRIALGGMPVAAAFAPAGQQLAVVHFDGERQGHATIVDAASGQTLAVWKSPGLGRGRLQAVAWSADGQRLAIAGVHQPAGASGRAAIDALRGFVQEFDAASGAAGTLHEVAGDAVTDLRAAPAGAGWAFGSFDGRWGFTSDRVDASVRDERRLGGSAGSSGSVGSVGSIGSVGPVGSIGSVGSVGPVRRPDRLWLAPGGVVQWQGAGAAVPQHFSLPERLVRAGAAAGARAPEEPSAFPGFGHASRDWDSVANATPTIQGATMALAAGEISRAAARIPGSEDVVWGTGHRLARVAPGGRFVWSLAPGTETRAVHASADGTQVVAAMSDGTLRWHRARDGALLLTLFVLGPQQWVLWSPSGYYDASAGAEPLLGWLLPPGEAAGGAGADGAGSSAGGGAGGEAAAGVGRPAATAAGPTFIGIARFRERFHRPDIIDRIVGGDDETLARHRADAARAEALRAQADAERAHAAAVPAQPALPMTALAPSPSVALQATLPPVLLYKQSPAVVTQADRVTLRFALAKPAGDEPITSLVVRRDGLLQEDARVRWPAAGDASAAAEVSVAVPPGESVVHVAAANANGYSDALTFKVRRETPAPAVSLGPSPAPPAPPAPPVTPAPATGPAAPGTPASPSAAPTAAPDRTDPGSDDRPRLFALLVGVGRYADPQVNGLDLPAKDAADMARVLAAQQGRAYRAVQTRVLADEQATRQAITSGLEWLARSVGPRDFGVLFLAGHALNHSNGHYYFLGHDVATERLATTAVPQAQIRSALARLKGRAVLFVDTCHAGHVFGAGRAATHGGAATAGHAPASSNAPSRDLARLANELASPENGVIVFASSTGRQLSLESREWGNGAFTRAIVAGLNGGADLMGRGRVTFQGLGYYVSSEVEKLTGGRQTPVVIAPPPGLPDFTLALLRSERVGAAQGTPRFAGLPAAWPIALAAPLALPRP